MYNRYIRNDEGTYTRIPAEDGSPEAQSADNGQTQGRQQPFGPPPPGRNEHTQRRSGGPDGLTGFLRHLLDQLHLEHLDTGDLLLVALLFLLLREEADDELLIALGLLLIL